MPGSQHPAGRIQAPAEADTAVRAAPREGGKVQINYENADLYDFISEISSMLGLTPLIVDADVKGSVNIISTGPMAKSDVLPLFNLILKNNNAALIKQGDLYQIVPISSALKKGVEVIELPTSGPAQCPGFGKGTGNTAGPCAARGPENSGRFRGARERDRSKPPDWRLT